MFHFPDTCHNILSCSSYDTNRFSVSLLGMYHMACIWSAIIDVLPVFVSLDLLPSVLWHCWLGARKSIRPVKTEWWGVGVVIYLERRADCLHIVQLMPLHPKTPSSLASFKCKLVLPFLYHLTQVVLENWPLSGCSVVVVFVSLYFWLYCRLSLYGHK